MSKRVCVAGGLAALLVGGEGVRAGVNISEFCSDVGNNTHYEFVEFTNTGTTPVNMTGWSEDDSHATPNLAGHMLTGFGTLAPGASAILTEATPADFRAFWGSGLPAGVVVLGPYTTDNLSTTSDSITLFDATGTLVDRLDYSTTNGGTADMVTRNAPLGALGLNRNGMWVDSTIGDVFGSFRSVGAPTTVGSPGHYLVPAPASFGVVGALGVLHGRRRRSTRDASR